MKNKKFKVIRRVSITFHIIAPEGNVFEYFFDKKEADAACKWLNIKQREKT
jgi:hypothetical protein